jgi:hypothetical protein
MGCKTDARLSQAPFALSAFFPNFGRFLASTAAERTYR